MPLISAADLHANLRLIDARQSADDYTAGHLPGAVHAALTRDLSSAHAPGHDPAQGGRHPLPAVARFAALLGAWGIGPDTDVVVYDASGGGNAAARLWWMLRAVGHTRVRVLDGGLQAATQAGHALIADVPSVDSLPPYPSTAWSLPMATAAQVDATRQDPTCRLIDVRTADRWRGETEPFDPVAGRVPGSRNLPWPENLGPDGRFKSPADLRTQLQATLDGVSPNRLTVHCGSGVTACHTLLALEIAGMPGASLYVGSWSEWCRGARPIGTGAAPPHSPSPP